MTEIGRKRPRKWLTDAECNRLLDAFGSGPTGVRNRALIVVLWRAGLRLQEALDLQRADLNAKKRTLRIQHGKNDKARWGRLDAQAWAVVQQWLDVRTKWPNIHEPEIFVTLRGRKLSQQYVRAMCLRMGAKAKIETRVHPHGFRHAYAEGLAREGVNLRTIQLGLGHAHPSTTDIYLRDLSPEELFDAIDNRPAWRDKVK